MESVKIGVLNTPYLKQIFVSFLLLIPTTSSWALDNTNCSLIAKDAQRLVCYDTKHRQETKSERGSLRVEKINYIHEIENAEEREPGRLTSNLPNVFSVVTPQKGEKLDDDVHAEFNLSIKYPLVAERFEEFTENVEEERFKILDPLRPVAPDKLYFIYNGRYDFYLFPTERYRSAPVISRLQNPGLAVEWDLKGDNHRRIRLGWFHESNGQSIDNMVDYEAQRDELGSNREPKGDEFALAQVSRGWDYAQIRYESTNPDVESNWKDDWWRYNVELRLFCDCQGLGSSNREDDIFWKPVDEQPKIRDYDGFRFMGEYAFNEYLMLRGEFKTGISDIDSLSHFGGRLSLGITFRQNTRFSLFYFNGYGKEPSTYHLRTRYAGIGLELR